MSGLVSAGLFLSVACTGVRAKLSEPDAILWGSIVVEGQTLTAGRTDVTVQARRGVGGTILATYRMGSEPAAGDRYLLRIPLETSDAPVSPLAATVGTTLQIQVLSAVEVLDEVIQTVAERGQFRRVDFVIGTPPVSTLPVAWQIRYFGVAGQDPNADSDGDGRTNHEEFMAGTDPTEPDVGPSLDVEPVPAGARLVFRAEAAAGAGYEGLSRYYTLETVASLGEGWIPVNGMSDIVASGQVVTHVVTGPADIHFFRLRIAVR